MNRMNTAGVIDPPGQQIYDNLLDYTIKGVVPKDSNPIKGFRHLIYKETIYPKEQHTYLAKSRGRTLYTEDSNEITAKLGDQRTFWRDSLGNHLNSAGNGRLRSQANAKNAFGFTESTPIASFSYSTASARSIFALDTGTRTSFLTAAFVGQVGLNSYTDVTLTNTLFKGDNGQLSIPNITETHTASFAYEYHNNTFFNFIAGTNGLSSFIPTYQTDKLSGKKPFFDSYDEYSADIRLFGQDHTVLPEYRVSENMEYFLENGVTKPLNNFLILEGGHLSQSATSETSEYDSDFYDIYSHSDFLKHFEVIRTEHEESPADLKQTKITVKCHGVKKLLPYNGFYPSDRTVQLGSLFSSSFGPYMLRQTGLSDGIEDDQGRQATLAASTQPLFNPGILYNTIKSGIAVDWLATSADVIPHTITTGPSSGTPSNKIPAVTGDSFSFRLPFETLANPEKYYPVGTKADTGSILAYQDTSQTLAYGNVSSVIGSQVLNGVQSIWNGQNKENYSLAMNNFLAEIPNFFLQGGLLSRLESNPEASFVSGVIYYMDLDLYKSDNTVMYEGPDTVKQSDDYPAEAMTNDYTRTGYTDRRQLRGMHYGPKINVATGTMNATSSYSASHVSLFDPAFAPWTPPYFYGRSTARFRFAPHEFVDLNPGDTIKVGAGANDYKMGEIVAHIATAPSGVIFFNDYSLDASGHLKNGLVDPTKLTALDNTYLDALATKNQMNIASSMNIFGLVGKPDFKFDAEGNVLETDPQTEKTRWVIYPKFECPTLNFANNDDGNYSPLNGGRDDYDYIPRGMWRGYANKQFAQQGIYYNLRESTVGFANPPTNMSPDGDPLPYDTVGSLKRKLFTDKPPKRVGLRTKQRNF